jgi:hypothetical protein
MTPTIFAARSRPKAASSPSQGMSRKFVFWLQTGFACKSTCEKDREEKGKALLPLPLRDSNYM